MNEKTAKQIENLKKQTIGVEIEMNHITRERAAKLAADHFGTGRYEYTAETATALGRHGMHRAENGNSRKTSALQDAMPKSANWSHRFFTTATLRPCKNWSENFAKPEQSAMQASEPEYTFTLEQTDTHRKLCETSPTLWRAMND